MRELNLTIVKLPIESLKVYEKNARAHPEKQIEKIAKSIKEFGFNDPIAVDHNNQIIAGHGRLLAAKLLEMDEVPVVRLSHLSAAQQKAYVIAHNKIALEAGWDYEILKDEFDELRELNFDLYETGFEEKELQLIYKDTAIELTSTENKEDEKKKLTECPACGHQF